ncbi:uncharacterized protein N7487_000544 [Penicillium crustosum]|uniref:uncharacterized protein n=1 Tax=Penicillium crustosum TaxID=36656 RepID=UPI0023A39A43|nr:uncharacterized protein N7487_000544 [Penicillium crustosum]KAJ5416994.1 hypothetical protein N7487_000544 [Penicillium crustosum]
MARLDRWAEFAVVNGAYSQIQYSRSSKAHLLLARTKLFAKEGLLSDMRESGLMDLDIAYGIPMSC